MNPVNDERFVGRTVRGQHTAGYRGAGIFYYLFIPAGPELFKSFGTVG